ncbi:helix-turn-helix domain-containing protein [Streptomyces niveus]|uniref:helix-turn-helix domain-containing protein n=1 Tax=Streptomyces niveus TaxID=193462 RepID=UPI0036AAE469
MTQVHKAREALGRRLRELRKDAGLTGRQLAESLAWPPSKVSKLENGRQTPTDADIVGWVRATGREGEAEALLAALHTLEVQHADWRRQFRGGLKAHQNELAAYDARAGLIRAFEATVVPGLLQTDEYARGRLAQGVELFGAPDDIDEAVRARTRRQEILYRRDKKFHFVLTEAALRFRLCPPDVMLGQLDRLIAISALPNVRLGVIGFDDLYGVAPWHGFWIFDRKRVVVETYSAELNLAQPAEVALYEGVFDRLAAVASYGRAARAVVTRVIDETPSS